MKRKNTTRNALLMSVISMLLCVSMLVGTTFAWFTDEVVSGTNVIAAGNLDVELYNSLVIDENKKVNTATKLFDEITLWEPGVVAFENLTVANLGTLALKYQLSINFTDATTNANGDTLAKVLKVGFVEGGIKSTTREGALTEVTAWQPLESFVQPGDLAVGENDVYGIVIYWQPSDIDNEFNMNNENQGKIMSINLGVKLLATQLEAESDSFGPDYDEDAWHNAMVVTNMDELLQKIENAEDGTLIVLGNDIESSDGVLITDKKITIDLNGKTLTVSEGANTNNRNFKITGNSEVTIQNGTLVAAGDMTSGAYGTVRTEDAAKVTLNNVKLYSYRGYGLNVKANTGTEITLNDSEIYAQYSGGVEAAGGTIVLNNTKIEQTGVYSGAAWCSVAIGVNGGGKVTVNSGTYSASAIATDSNAAQGTWVAYVMSSGGTLDINGGTFNGAVAETASAANACGVICADRAAVVNINGGTFNSNGAILDMRNNVGTLPNPVATLKGGIFSADPRVSGLYSSNLIEVASGYQVVDNGDGTYTVLKGDVYVKNTAELVAAIQAGKTEIFLAAGNYVMPDSWTGAHDTYNQAGYDDGYAGVDLQNKTLTLIGSRNAVIDAKGIDSRDQFVTGATLAFEGVTVNFGTNNYMGFMNTASLTYKDCAVNGLQFFGVGGPVAFVDCDLNSNGAEHSVWTWGGQNVSFTGCDFTYADRAVNCYGQGVTTNASFTDCTFTKVAGKDTTGAIETNSSELTALNLTINNCTVNEGDLWWVSTWDGKGGANTTVTLDGKTTVATAAQLAAVVAKGITDINLMDGEYDVYGCGGKTLTINGSENAVIKLYNDGEDGCDYAFGGNGTGVGDVTFNGVTIDTTSNTGNYKGFAYMKGTFNDCNFVGAYSLNNANDFVFNRCTFDFKNGYFWTWGANSVTFNACVFNGNSKAILAHGYASTVITIKDCKFNATEQGLTGAGDNTAAVEIDPAGSNTYTIIFEGENTKTGSYAGWTRVKDGSTGHTITGLN